MLVILDDKTRAVFAHPRGRIRAYRAQEVPAALAAMEAARAAGHHVAGWFAYELGYALEPRLTPLMPPLNGPLLSFGVYGPPGDDMSAPTGRAYAGPLRADWDRTAYARAFDTVRAAIASGDIYQANLSFRARFAFLGDAPALYEQLRAQSAAPHCAFVEEEGRAILSLSPELFFAVSDDLITARPMKGTAPRGDDDAAARAALVASPKDRAENLMIVDLIRNDLGRVAQTGSVKVADMFAVETYPSLHTMVSTVTARLRPGAGIGDVVTALFPCGSITGAPKIRAMEILRDLESSPRGAYCGAIGCFFPNGDARFNVAIRTLTIQGGSGVLGVGGGVVQDSRAGSEYDECLLKARFFTQARRPLHLIETLKWDAGKWDLKAEEGGFVRLESHLARMAASASVFGLSFDMDAARRELARVVAGATSNLRVRLTLDEKGCHRAQAFPLPPNPPFWTYALADKPVNSADLLLRHKTSWRENYEDVLALHGTDEVIFRNERGELTEGARSNLFIRKNGKWLTPPLSCGVLDGRLRAEMIADGACEEALLRAEDLTGEVCFGNSLRGMVPARRL